MKLIGPALITLVSLTTCLSAESARPNVLILYADDLGYGDLRCNNPDSKIPTPNLNRLAREGMRFTDGHSSSGICTPSRYALLTGRHHWRDFHGIVGVFGKSVFKPERLTLPEMMQASGYSTACIGKWHLGWNWSAIRAPNALPTQQGKKQVWGHNVFDWGKSIPDGPLAHGFEHYFGDTVINFPPYCWIQDDRVLDVPDTMMDSNLWKPCKEGNWECRPGPMVSGWDPYQNLPTLAQRGEQYIRAHAQAEKPFFLYFAFPSPHAPIIPNDEFDGKSGAGPYGDFVYETDTAAGRLLDTIRRAGIEDNTIVIFTADNGPERYAYERDKKYDHWSSEPFRGLKRDIYEGGHHVPYIIKWPGKTQPKTVCASLVSQIDIMATLASAVGFELPHDAAEDSHDLLPLLEDPERKIRSQHVHNTYEGRYAVRDGNWLLVVGKDGYHSRRNADWEARRAYAADDSNNVELYDLANDIGQRVNVASENRQRVEKMRGLLASIQANPTAPRLKN